MKTNVLLIIFCGLWLNVKAQAPQKMSYQAVIRDASDNLVINHLVGIRITILEGALPGTAVYGETLTPTTNINGLVTVEIGGNTGFDSINWENGIHYIKTEIDPTGGANYVITSTSQLLSVPYALFANKAKTATDSALRAYVDLKFKLLTIAGQGVKDVNGNHYEAVLIGDQVWMAENLRTTLYNDGNPIPVITGENEWVSLTTGAYCWFNNDIGNKSAYGRYFRIHTLGGIMVVLYGEFFFFCLV